MATSYVNTVLHKGGCHCGLIRWEVAGPEELPVVDCNCTICSKKGHLHYIVPKDQFKLVQGEDKLSCYTFNTGVAKHYFCKVCGIGSFYVPRSNPDGIDVNARCIDSNTVTKTLVTAFDGRDNYEKNVESLAHLSKAPSV